MRSPRRCLNRLPAGHARRHQFQLPVELIAAGVAIGFATQTAAADIDDYLNGAAHRAVIERIIDAYEGPRRGRCADLRIIGSKATALRPISVNAEGAPQNGAWREAVVIDRCGRRVRHNVTFVAENGVLTPLGMAPGDTRVAQADQDMLATMAVTRLQDRAPKPECDAFVIYDTAARGSSAEWRETWTIDRCGARDNVRFTLSMQGDRMQARYTDP